MEDGSPLGTYVEGQGSTVECPVWHRPALREVFNRHLGPEGQPRHRHLASYANWRCGAMR